MLKDPFNLRFWFIADFIAFLFIALFWISILGYGSSLIGITDPISWTVAKKVCLCFAVVLTGAILLAIRLWLRRFYGILELSFAIGVVWQTVSSISELTELQAVLAMAASVYLVVQGLGNWLQGVEKHEARGQANQPTDEY